MATETNFSKFKAWVVLKWKWILGVLAFIIFLGRVLDLPGRVHKFLTPDVQLANEEIYVPGVLVPKSQIIDGKISLLLGTISLSYSVAELEYGMDVSFLPWIGGAKCQATPTTVGPIFPTLVLKIINGRLYVQDSVYSLENNEL